MASPKSVLPRPHPSSVPFPPRERPCLKGVIPEGGRAGAEIGGEIQVPGPVRLPRRPLTPCIPAPLPEAGRTRPPWPPSGITPRARGLQTAPWNPEFRQGRGAAEAGKRRLSRGGGPSTALWKSLFRFRAPPPRRSTPFFPEDFPVSAHPPELVVCRSARGPSSRRTTNAANLKTMTTRGARAGRGGRSAAVASAAAPGVTRRRAGLGRAGGAGLRLRPGRPGALAEPPVELGVGGVPQGPPALDADGVPVYTAAERDARLTVAPPAGFSGLNGKALLPVAKYPVRPAFPPPLRHPDALAGADLRSPPDRPVPAPRRGRRCSTRSRPSATRRTR